MAKIFNISEAVKLSAFNVLQEPIQMLLEGQIEAFEKKSLLDKIYVMKTTDRYQEEFRSSTSMDGFKPTEDLQPAGLSDFEEGYKQTFTNQIWTNSFVISKQAIEDNQDLSISPKALNFIKSYYRTRERYGFAMLSGALAGTINFENKVFSCKGMDTTDGTVDGPKQNFFHKAHLPLAGVVGGVTQSNMFYGSVTLTGSNAAEQMLSLIGQVENRMQNYKDYKGNPLVGQPTRLVIPNHYLLKKVLQVALHTQFTSEMGDNGINIQYGKWEIIDTPYLATLTGFEEKDQAFLMISPEVNRDNLGAVWMDRVPLEISSYIDNKTKANVWDGRARFGVGFGDFSAMAYVCSGSAGTYRASCTQLTLPASV